MADLKSMTDHKTIWLQPWCGECELHAWDVETSRQWCQDNPWEDCECGAKPVKYELAIAQLTGCLHPGNEPNSCQHEGQCLSAACNHNGKTWRSPVMTLQAQVDGILYPKMEI